jgi:type II secretory pathway pseudopilin PulG
MTREHRRSGIKSFSLVEVVLAIGVVGFSVLATIGLLSVASDTNKRARDEGNAARLTSNEFERLQSLSSSSSFWVSVPPSYPARYFDSDLKDLGTDRTTALAAGAVYELQITFIAAPTPGNPTPNPTPPPGTADLLLNAEVRYPVQAPSANQSKYQFTTLMNIPGS